jgi:hypothetical protein
MPLPKMPKNPGLPHGRHSNTAELCNAAGDLLLVPELNGLPRYPCAVLIILTTICPALCSAAESEKLAVIGRIGGRCRRGIARRFDQWVGVGGNGKR